MWIYSKRCGYNEKDVSMLKKMWIYLSQKPLSLSELLLLTIKPIDHQSYTIVPINYRAYQPPSLSTIKPIDHQSH